MVAGFEQAYGQPKPVWIAASEYTITPVDHVTYPNRMLRNAGLLSVTTKEDGEHLDLAGSAAWALVDHQLAHVFVKNKDDIAKVADVFRKQEGIAEVLVGNERGLYELDHERAGEVVLVSTSNSWMAYYWWLDDAKAPKFAPRSTFTANPVTTRSSCTSILPPRAFRSTPRAFAARTEPPPAATFSAV